MGTPTDKRTKEYKEWKKNHDEQNSTGLGDFVESITEATGVKKVVDTVFDKLGKDCGCNKRKEKLNKVRMRFKAVSCFTEDQYNAWTKFRQKHPSEGITHKEQTEIIIPIYKQLFSRTFKPQSCCLEGFVNDINKVYEAY